MEYWIITDRVRSTREGYVLTRVCPSICLSTPGGGYPSQIQMGVPLLKGYPTLSTPPPFYLVGGTPPQVPPPSIRPGWGVPPPPPPSDLAGGYPRPGGNPPQVTPPPPHQTWPEGGYPTSGGVLDTPRSVCLLRSRRRTFLFY